MSNPLPPGPPLPPPPSGGPPSGYPLPPVAPYTPPGRRSNALVLVAVVVVVAMFVGAIAVGVQIADGGGERADGDDATPSEDTLGDDELAALVDELSGFVEDARGLRFREEVDLEVLDGDAYRERTTESAESDLEEDTEDLVNSAGALQALGLWSPGTDPLEIARRFAAVSSIGFYDPDTQEIVVLGGADTPNLRVTLVHELTHALDDQHFDLGRREDLLEQPDESGWAFTALVEGNASRVDSTYEATLTDDERESILDEQMAQIEGVDLSGIPPVLFAQQQIIYTEGEAFATAVYEEGGNEAVDDALEDPPTTSEQILEPDDWPERETVVEVEVPEADEEALTDGAMGQALLGILVEVDGGAGDLPEWEGDNSVLWADGDAYCLRFAVAQTEDGPTWEDALQGWADRVDADMEVEDDLLVVTSCR